MDSEVFWISTTQLEFRERIYTWDGRCWADKNGVSRTSYLMDKGIIAAGYEGGGKDKKLAGGMKGKNNKGDNTGEKSRDIKLEGDNKEAVIDTEGDNEGVHKEPVVDNKEGDKIGNDTDNEGDKSIASEQLCLSSASEQLCSVFERFPVKRELYDV